LHNKIHKSDIREVNVLGVGYVYAGLEMREL